MNYDEAKPIAETIVNSSTLNSSTRICERDMRLLVSEIAYALTKAWSDGAQHGRDEIAEIWRQERSRSGQ